MGAGAGPKAKQGWPYTVPRGSLFLVSYEF
jgi:hypothetical protein